MIIDGSGVHAGSEPGAVGSVGTQTFDRLAQLERIVGDEGRAEVSHRDLLSVTADVEAMLVENLQLGGNIGGAPEQIALVGELGDQAQCTALPAATHQDRDVGLERSRITHGLFHGDRLSFEAGRARAPEQGEQPEGILETWDVFAPDGEYLRQVPIPLGHEMNEGTCYLGGDGRMVVVRGTESAFSAEEDDGETEIEPLEVICYEIE